MRTIPWLATLPLLALIACDGNLDEAAGGCDETATELAVDEVSALGFAADELLANIAGPRNEILEWTDGAQTGILVEMVNNGAVHYVDSEPKASEGGMEDAAAALCEDRIEVDAQVIVSTDDGLLDETLDVTLTADEATSADFYLSDLTPDDLNGTYDYREIDMAQYDTFAISIHGAIGIDSSWGQISEFGEYEEEGDGDSGVAMAENIETGAWPVDE